MLTDDENNHRDKRQAGVGPPDPYGFRFDFVKLFGVFYNLSTKFIVWYFTHLVPLKHVALCSWSLIIAFFAKWEAVLPRPQSTIWY